MGKALRKTQQRCL